MEEEEAEARGEARQRQEPDLWLAATARPDPGQGEDYPPWVRATWPSRHSPNFPARRVRLAPEGLRPPARVLCPLGRIIISEQRGPE
jgi:hypothetical protein